MRTTITLAYFCHLHASVIVDYSNRFSMNTRRSLNEFIQLSLQLCQYVITLFRVFLPSVQVKEFDSSHPETSSYIVLNLLELSTLTLHKFRTSSFQISQLLSILPPSLVLLFFLHPLPGHACSARPNFNELFSNCSCFQSSFSFLVSCSCFIWTCLLCSVALCLFTTCSRPPRLCFSLFPHFPFSSFLLLFVSSLVMFLCSAALLCLSLCTLLMEPSFSAAFTSTYPIFSRFCTACSHPAFSSFRCRFPSLPFSPSCLRTDHVGVIPKIDHDRDTFSSLSSSLILFILISYLLSPLQC